MKHLIFSILAVIVSVGSAISYVKANNAAVTPFVDYSTNNTANVYCSTVSGSCDGSGAQNCKITVTVQGQSAAAFRAENSACSQVLLDDATASVGSITLPSDADVKNAAY